ncbi:RNA polymerase sigma factor [Nocardia niigatensis]|uniref:RNA polymerase sigma factor n=1 Tax=Nocardia niigatensis TaxID=209249 RepID=UPI0002D9F7B3|nr:sigma-70 family RNA polymerase sigma factor [Nocardia niigatensis]
MIDDPDHLTGETHPTTARPRPDSGSTDLDEFKEFYREFIKPLIGFLMWQGASLADASEVAQETMTKAMTCWADIRNPKAWTRLVAGRALVRRFASVDEDPVAEVSERPALLYSDADLDAWEQRQDVMAALAKLPPRQRQVMAWTLQEYTPSEIADTLQIAATAVRANLKKARRNIAIHLAAGNEDQ